ncbi:MAG: CotH kinase family protein [Chlamydiae bacterium]|nr:CotH kinase family protein [Chlamydiota bacterium]MBI3266851.1 CotH kinase family protein [Chlamydiota bacterium]
MSILHSIRLRSRIVEPRRWLKFFVLLFLIVLFYQTSGSLFKILDKKIRHAQTKISRHLKESGVAACWSFDDSLVIDSIGYEKAVNRGILSVRGKYGQARWFYGRLNNFLQTRFTFSQLQGSYSLSFWVKILNLKKPQLFISNWQGSLHDVWFEGGKIFFRVPVRGQEEQILCTPFQSHRHAFTHVACVVDLERHQASLWEDGVLKSSRPVSEIFQRPDEMIFGSCEQGHSSHFILDEVVIRSRALQPEEVLQEAKATRSLSWRFKPQLVFELKMWRALRNIVWETVKGLDLLNPFQPESRIHKTSLKRFSLFLSKQDLKALNQSHDWSMTHGIIPSKISKSRAIRIEAENHLYKAQIELAGDVGRMYPTGQKTFVIRFLGRRPPFSMRNIIFVPPEENGILRPLLEEALRKKYHRSPLGIQMCGVWVNGVFQGLYEFQDEELFSYAGDSHEPWEILSFLKGIPAFKKEILHLYDDLAKTYVPLFLCDHSSPVPSREILYRVSMDRKKLVEALGEEIPDDPFHRIEWVEKCLNEKMFLGDNPGAEGVIKNLDFSFDEVNGVHLEFESSDPSVINHEGKVLRPTNGGSKEVMIRIHLSCEKLKGVKTLRFIVLPSSSKLDILQILSSRPILSRQYVPCLAKFLNLDPKESPFLPGKIKLRGNTALYYPKKSYKLRLRSPFTYRNFKPSTDFILMSCYVDHTFMKNQLAYDLFRSFSKEGHPEHTPQHHLLEIFLNGEYQGIYEICEKVNASVLGLKPYHSKDSTHSVIYKAKGKHANFEYESRDSYQQKEPDLKYEAYWGPYEEFIRFLSFASTDEFQHRVKGLMDIENVMDFQILINFAYNVDGPQHNLFICRDKGVNQKFFIVPWDYDKTFGGPSDWILSDHLFERLMRELPGYKEALRDRWKELKEGPLLEESLMKRMDDVEARIHDRVAENFRKWPLPAGESHEGAVLEMRAWIKKRLAFLDQYVEDICKQSS